MTIQFYLSEETENEDVHHLPGSHCSTQDKKGSYIARPRRPTESQKDPSRDKAEVRFVDALNQVPCTVVRQGRCNPNAVHYNSEGQLTITALYVGNLDYNADSKSLLKALQKYFHHRIIKLKKVEVPE